MIAEKTSLLEQSYRDIYESYDELLYLIYSALSRLESYIHRMKDIKQTIRPDTYSFLGAVAENSAASFRTYHIESSALQKRTSYPHFSEDELHHLIERKGALSDRIRAQYSLLGSILTLCDWQSPSFISSGYHQAGKQLGEIKGNLNDYKRDVHNDAKDYETRYLKEYVDAPLKFLIKAYMVSSGMAAFTTILNFLMGEGVIKTRVMIGKHTYFEAKELLHEILKEKVIEVDETDTEEFINAIIKHNPDAIFLDSLCNTKEVTVPDIPRIYHYLLHKHKKETYLVLDTTGLSVFSQPFKSLSLRSRKLRVLSYESLNKYLQMGMDRVTGGMIMMYGKHSGKLYYYREHLGTNIADSSVYSIPIPSRKYTERRMRKIGRNTLYLASELSRFIASRRTHFKTIIYPGLSGHSCFSYTRTLPFHGGFFNLEPHKKHRNQSFYRDFLKKTMKTAQKMNIPLIAGTSFGLDITRIYLTALNNDYGEPFIRISPGTETMWEMERLKKLFMEVLK